MDIFLFNVIGEGSSTALSIQAQLQEANGDPVEIMISSPGGSVTEGIAIANMLKAYSGSVTTNIIGEAFSMASIIAMVGSHVKMSSGALLMIHNPRMASGGTAKQLNTMAGTLEGLEDTMASIYAAKTSLSREQITGLMDEETFFTANEALEFGFIDEVTKQLEAVAYFKLNDEDMNLKDKLMEAFKMEKVEEDLLPEGEIKEEIKAEAVEEAEEEIQSTAGADMLLADKASVESVIELKKVIVMMLQDVFEKLEQIPTKEVIEKMILDGSQKEVKNTLSALQSKRANTPVATADNLEPNQLFKKMPVRLDAVLGSKVN
jgi:ATP-dependent Clp endopeptidase proteolytic subunit ClpP